MTIPIDHKERLLATDPSQSFIVQAPAGSGKTALLVQRFLRLLASVERPEQIIALTFTRKAANEMRERIVHTLQAVVAGETPTSSHDSLTYQYAKEALARDNTFGWQLQLNPSRLHIMTIDGFCQMLAKRVPHITGTNHMAEVSETPYLLYKTAAEACLAHTLSDPDYQAAIKTLLKHLGNRQDALIQLWCSLLATREQWMEPLLHGKTLDKSQVESALVQIEQHELNRLREAFPDEFTEILMPLAREIASLENNPDSPRYVLRDWESLDACDRDCAKGLAALLLTGQDTLRKQFTHHVGLRKTTCTPDQYQRIKETSTWLLESLAALPDFIEALIRVKDLPQPTYDPSQWETLQALFIILPLLVAHLDLTFDTLGSHDFIKVADNAKLALGLDDAPTDLALHLDYRIQHLLIDEFQDTSLAQYQLLTKLVAEWEPGDGKSLFLVGDPMQSIYRFRAAEVGLFLRVQQHGIANVKPTPIQLQCNFRSTASIITWINQHFATIFPGQDDIESGAIRFHPAISMKPDDTDPLAIQAWHGKTIAEEAEGMARTIASTLAAHPEDNIAILVRSRRQLPTLIQTLKAHDIPFQGIEIDLLSTLPHFRDVWLVTQALLQPANRLAWLGLLRSPWCGLSLHDLHEISLFLPHHAIVTALTKLDHIPNLSEAGKTRARWLLGVMQRAFARRQQDALVPWIMQTLVDLNLNNILDDVAQADLEQYWMLLEQFESDGQVSDLDLFQSAFNQLYAKQSQTAAVSIMTIHKSKGLEFDTVILPALGRRARGQSTTLLRWLRLPTDLETLFLLSPMKSAIQERCALYDYLSKIDAEKDTYEQQRLLYVAATRAKKRLVLCDQQEAAASGSFRTLLTQQPFEPIDIPDTAMPSEPSEMPVCTRLPERFFQQPLPSQTNQGIVQLELEDTPMSKHIGIVIHDILQGLATQPDQPIPWSYVSGTLKAAGFYGTALTDAMDTIQAVIKRFTADKIGQWIIAPREQAWCEWPLLSVRQGETVTRIVDRTFIEDNTRWIIDYKMATDNDANLAAYKEQVNEYASLFAQLEPHLDMACGVYFLNKNKWIPWTFERMIQNVSEEVPSA